jgi:hypothetical protein
MAWFTAHYYGQCDSCSRFIQARERAYLVEHYGGVSELGGAWPDNLRLLCGSCGPKDSEGAELNPVKFADITADDWLGQTPRCWCGRPGERKWNPDTDSGSHTCRKLA